MNVNPKVAPRPRPTSSQGDLNSYLQGVGSLSRLSVEDELAFAVEWHDHGSQSAREKLISGNLRLVVMVAKRYVGRGLPLDELIADGNVGLIHAVDHFDPRAGARLATYAIYWIRSSISEAFARTFGRVPLSRSLRADAASVEAATSAFRMLHGRDPEETDLATELNWPPPRVRGAKAALSSRTRLLRLEDVDAPAMQGPQSEVLGNSDNVIQVDELLSSLTETERRVVQLRFGLGGGQALSATEVARETQSTARFVRSCLETAMRKLTRSAAQIENTQSEKELQADRFESAYASNRWQVA